MNYQDPGLPDLAAPAASAAGPSPTRLRRAVIWAVLVAMLAVGAIVGFDLFRKQMMASFFASRVPPPVAVSFETITTGSVARNLSSIGSVAAVHQVTISPETAGMVTSIAFVAGQPVKKGDLLLQLNDATERAELDGFRAQQKLAEVALKRARQLAGSSAASQAQLDQAQSSYDTATAGIARAEAVINQKALRAPFDGTLGVRLTEVGHFLDRGKPAVQLTNLDELYIEFTLPEQARPQLSLGQAIEVSVDAYAGRSFTGQIAVIDPQINVATRSIRIQAVVANPEQLLNPGMFATVNVALPPAEGQITIAETALSYSLYGNFVYVVEAEGANTLKAKRTTVKTGAAVDGRLVVTEGLKAGDRVVTTGLGKLFDGAQLTLSETPTLVKPAAIPRS